MRKLKFNDNSIYHICNRGVEKRAIFLDEKDYYRFIHDLYEFNDTKPAENVYYKNSYKPYETGTRKHERKKLVEILAFCLMPNHFHLLLRQLKENGISTFMNKLGGYSMYFNKRYQRIGGLFQGRFKAVEVTKNEHFLYLPYYIHLNPLDLMEPTWREGAVKNLDGVLKFLESYRWSSYLDYIGNKNFPSVIQKQFLSEFFETPKKYKEATMEWLKNIAIISIKSLILE